MDNQNIQLGNYGGLGYQPYYNPWYNHPCPHCQPQCCPYCGKPYNQFGLGNIY